MLWTKKGTFIRQSHYQPIFLKRVWIIEKSFLAWINIVF